jgi:hypothetical protein
MHNRQNPLHSLKSISLCNPRLNSRGFERWKFLESIYFSVLELFGTSFKKCCNWISSWKPSIRARNELVTFSSSCICSADGQNKTGAFRSLLTSVRWLTLESQKRLEINVKCRFKALMAVVLKGYILWAYCRIARWESERPCLLPNSCHFLAWLVLLSWRRRRHAPPKHRLTSTGLHGVIAQNMKHFNAKIYDREVGSEYELIYRAQRRYPTTGVWC